MGLAEELAALKKKATPAREPAPPMAAPPEQETRGATAATEGVAQRDEITYTDESLPYMKGADRATRAVQTKGAALISGDLAKALNPNPGGGIDDELDSLKAQALGDPPKAKREVVLDGDQLRIKKDTQDALRSELDDLKEQASGGPTFATRAFRKAGEGLKGLGHVALQVLSADENLEVAGIRKLMKLPPQKDFMSNTYSNLFKELGAPDDVITEAMGLGAALLLSPVSGLSVGTRAAAKIGKRAALSASGMKAAQEIAAARTAEQAVAKGMKEGDPALNILARQNFEETQKELAKHFGEVSKITEGVKVGPEVAALPESAFDRGGVKMYGKTLISGEEISRALKASGVTRVIGAIQANPQVAAIKKTLGKAFIPNFGVDKQVLDLIDTAKSDARLLHDRHVAYTEKWFSRYGIRSDAQKKDFYDSVSEAFGKEDLVGQVTSKAGDENVQRGLDRWLGQGAYAGKRSFADRIAKLALLSEDEKVANWFPGISAKHAGKILEFRLPSASAPAERLFNRPREGAKVRYVTDPVQAIALRRTQVAMANIQDRIFETIKRDKLGDPKSFSSLAEASKAGYVPLATPYATSFPGIAERAGVNPAALPKAKDITFVRKDFYDSYKTAVVDPLSESTTAQTVYDLLNWPGKIWKRHVTASFPAFHFRNFVSNQVLNAGSIGRFAVSPQLHAEASALLTKPSAVKIKTSIGERFSGDALIKEAEKHGLLKGGQFIADLGGEMLDAELKPWYQRALSRMNPISEDFALTAAGRRVGDAIESHAKLVNYLYWRKQGLSPKLAAREAKDALFDYGEITDFEKWAKLVVPFYTFSRKNLEAQLKLLGRRPQALGAQLKAVRDLGPTEADWDGIPEFHRNKMIAKVMGKIATGFGLPIEDLLELTGQSGDIAGRFHPILKYGIEAWVTDKDLMSKRPLSEVNNANEFRSIFDLSERSSTPAPIRAAAKQFVDLLKIKEDRSKRGKLIGDPDRLHILRNLFTSRYQSMLGMLEKEDLPGWQKAMRIAMGVLVIDPDEKVKAFNMRRQEMEKLARDVNKHNLGRAIPLWITVGGREADRERANEALERAKTAERPAQLERARDLMDRAIERSE